MCYSKAEGGYRCMPPQKLLNAYKGKPGDDYAPRSANGAFWLTNPEKVSSFMEIEEEAAALRYSNFLIKDDRQLETEVSHLGNMISRYSDAQVDDFDNRLKHAQLLGLKYQDAILNRNVSQGQLKRMREKAVNANLAIGYESRFHLQETLKDLTHYGNPMVVDIKDDEGIESQYRQAFRDSLRQASLTYPTSWNHALDDSIQLTYVFENEGDSLFNRNNNEIKIAQGAFKFASYKSLSEAEDAYNKNWFEYTTNVEMVHELAHKFEFIQPDIVRVSRSFLKRRALPGQHVHFGGYKAVKDHFTWSYAGQMWGNRHTEVFSVGMESTILGTQGSAIGLALPVQEDDDPIQIYRPDIEHRNLTLGILAALDMPFNNDAGYEDPENKTRKEIQTMFGKVKPFDFE